MGKVQDMIIDNFKSYQGRVRVGPFRHFTCIIGPNGAGKSNLMDAISFVLGVQARQLRSERLRDLVYRREGEDPRKNERTASVELTYVGEEGDVGGADTLVFQRLILRTGEARFQVNGEVVPQADYQRRLESINILSKVRNFLVFQGDVEAVANRQGKDLTAFFEQISGSDTFKQEYERLALEKTKIEDNARYLFTKKRNAMNEKKRVAHQKEEADEYRRIEAERRNLQLEFVLFRLHGLARQSEEAAQSRAQLEEERDVVRTRIEGGREGLASAEREKAKAHLATTQAERTLATARAKADQLNPEKVATRTRITFLQQRVTELKVHLEHNEKKRGQVGAQVETLRLELEKLEAEEQALREKIAQRELQFTPEQRKEFERAKKTTEQITASMGDRARDLEHQVQAAAAERARSERERREAQALSDHLRKRVVEIAEQVSAAEKAAARDSERSAACTSQLERLQTSLSTCLEEKEQLQAERQQLLDTIQDITATERQLERERQLAKVCAEVAAAVPGVCGRVVDLCRPSQKRLHVAVNVAIGKYLDAVVVDSSETARRCVRFLKERMLEPLTFLPLQDLRAPEQDPRLQDAVSNSHGLRLGLNCVTFDEGCARAFEFLLGDVVVADTMADGRSFAFGEGKARGLSAKIVTLAGEAIAKNGNLSVNSDATREGATRFDLSDVESNKSRLDAIDARLNELHKLESGGGADVSALREEARRMQDRSEEASARLSWCQEQSTVKANELKTAEAQLDALAPECARLAHDEESLREEQRRIDAYIGKAVASHFAPLSAAMGVDDVRTVERQWRRERELMQVRSDELGRQLHNARAEKLMLEQTLVEQDTHKPSEKLPEFEAELGDLRRKIEVLSRDGEVMEAEVREHDLRFKECESAELEREIALARARKEAKGQREQVLALEKRLGELASEAKALGNARADILRQSVLEDIEVPLLAGDFEALQDIAERESQPASAPTQKSQADASNGLAVDFSALPSEKQAASTGAASKMLGEEYKEELERLRVELHRLSPNLKAIDQMQGVAQKAVESSHEAEVARRNIEDIEGQFDAVRKARKERFLECFEKVSAEISDVYRRLTANTAGLQSDGGSAYLDLEDTEDPFNGGIKFTAMPPAKRFRDMHLLSGGEKTLAAMSLLFAVHAFQKPPFMVLDEVDAALDANNVQSLANYVEKAGCQTIVISLKDRFFVKGEALVGVWKNKPKQTSAVLTLDLTRYWPAPPPGAM